jgi:hypothetical protein
MRQFSYMDHNAHKLGYVVGGRLLIYDFNQEVGGKTLKYERGTWTEIDTPLHLLTANSEHYGEDTWDKLLKRSGYETTPAKFGDTDSFYYEVYHANREERRGQPKYFVNICLGKHYQHVVVDNYPSLLQLLNFLGPIASSAVKMKASGGGVLMASMEEEEELQSHW